MDKGFDIVASVEINWRGKIDRHLLIRSKRLSIIVDHYCISAWLTRTVDLLVNYDWKQ